MEEMSKDGRIGAAAMKAGMDRKTAGKYVSAGQLPSEMAEPRDWRTRADPFDEHWSEVEARLRESPELEAKTLFEWLQGQHPERYAEGQLRTLQRRIRTWRAAEGPDKEVVFAQRHRPGEAMQLDFTDAKELMVTIAGVAFVHLLCVVTLPYSNWQWATVCLSESLMCLRRGLQRALFQLGRVTQWLQTDNSTAATHRIPEGSAAQAEGHKRTFNAAYLALTRHFGLSPRLTAVGAKEQNGDVEASNGAIKRRLEQALVLRGHRDFESVPHWQEFIDTVLRKANVARGARVGEELAVMRVLNAAKLPEYVEEDVRVSEGSTIRVKHCAYSVPSRLIGEDVRVRVFEDRIEVYHGGTLELGYERLRGDRRHRIDYRHVIWSLVKKPGAFARYVYREEMFPTLAFRRAYDVIQAQDASTRGDLEYLRILHLAASTGQENVEAALALLLEVGRAIRVDDVKAMVLRETRVAVPALEAPTVDLGAYDALLQEVA